MSPSPELLTEVLSYVLPHTAMFTTACSPKQHAWNPRRHKCCMRGLLMDSIAIIAQWWQDKALVLSAAVVPLHPVPFASASVIWFICIYPALTLLCCLSICMTVSTEAQQRPYYADYSPARLYIHTLCTSHYLDIFITFIIGINVFTMSMEHFNQPHVSLLWTHLDWLKLHFIFWNLFCLKSVFSLSLK